MLSTPGKLPRDGVSLLQEDQGGEGNEVGTCVSPLSEQQAQQGWQHGVFCLPGWAGDAPVLAGLGRASGSLWMEAVLSRDSQSTTAHSTANPPPAHVICSGNKQLFCGLPPTEAK